MITQTATVYMLQQNLHVTGKTKPIELTTYFLAKSQKELEELLDLFAHGRIDERIVEQEVPSHFYEPGFRMEWVSLTDPDGINLNEQYDDYPWGGNQ